MTHTCILLVIPLLLWFDIYVSAKVYYATPTCPEGDVSCMTLSQYATQPNNYFTSNITLILLPGNHSLDSELKIANITHLTIFASIPDTTVTCYQSVGFIFRGVGHINISGITFVGCMNNTITSVEDFALENCNFDGQYREGTAVYLQSVANAIISNNLFSSNTGYKPELIIHFYGDYAVFGGAMISINSKVFMSHCEFTANCFNNSHIKPHYAIHGTGGGAMYVESSDVTMGNCKFINNIAVGQSVGGGAVYAKDSRITITDCTFVKNTISGYNGGGGVYCENCSLILNSSSFISNTATGHGGAVYISVDSSFPVVLIDNSKFTNNKAGDGGAVYVEMEITSESATMLFIIKDSVFTNNSASSCGGALQVGVHNSRVDIYISNCEFRNNMAYLGGAVYFEVNDNVVTISRSKFINNRVDGIYGGIGGAIISRGKNVTLLSTSTSFINNSAPRGAGGAGGAVLMFSGSILRMNDTTFSFNSANQGSALSLENSTLSSVGVLNIDSNVANYSLVYVSQCTVSLSGVTTISNNIGSLFASNSNLTLSGNTTFMNNSYHSSSESEEGGAITSFQSNLFFHDIVNMLHNKADNGGAILAAESKVYMYGNITISGNRVHHSGGGISAFQSELTIKGHVRINANTAKMEGGGMLAIGSRVVVSSNLLFISNNSSRGGGVCLELNTKVYITKTLSESHHGHYGCSFDGQTKFNHNTWPRIVFTNNSADYGGAVYVNDDTYSGTCSTTYSTYQSKIISECFFQVLALYHLFCSCELDYQNLVNLNFSNNTATAKGNTIFGGLLDRCTMSLFAEYPQILHCNQSSVSSGISYLLGVADLKQSELSSEISSNPVRICFCKDGQRDCNYQPPPMSIMKGSLFNVSLVAVDQVNNIVPNATIHSSLLSGLGRLGERQAIKNTTDSETCTELQYNVFSSSHHRNETLLLYAEGPCKDTGISASHISLTFQDCPIGFQIGKDGDCSCDPALSDNITNCSISSQTVQRKGDVWISYLNDSKRGVGFIIKPYCPFDYCRPPSEPVYINFNIPNGADTQCAFNRSGILCGNCSENFSLSLGSSSCMSCSNDRLALLIPFAIAGIALVAFLVVFNLTVAVGTINGLIFYANIIAANQAVFQTHKLLFFNVFIAWLNLDFGFETCFYDGMDGLAKVWLQLVFPSYIILLVILVIVLCEYSSQFSRLLSYTNPVATLATLILLSYAKLLRTTIAALSFTTLEYPNGSDTVWLYDANIPYLDRKHIGLFVVALLILIIGLVYTFLLLFWQFLLRTKIIDWMRNNHNTVYTWYNIWIRRYLYSFMDVYHAPYNTSHRYWTGLLLLLRGVLYLTSAVKVFSDPSVNLLSISCVVMFLLVWKLNVHMTIYKGKFQNKLDICQIVNLGIFTAGTLYFRAVDNGFQNQVVLAYTSTSIAFLTFLGILCYHTKRIIPLNIMRLVKSKFNMRLQPDQNDYEEIVVETPDERIHLVSSVVPQTQIDGLPDRNQGSQGGEKSIAHTHSMCANTKL